MTTGTRSPEKDPEQDQPDKPDTPAEVSGRGWKYTARKAYREFSDDHCTDLAAALTYYAVLSIFPALIAVLSLLGVVGQSQQTIEAVMPVLNDVVGQQGSDTLEPVITTLASAPGAGLALVLGLATALWSASGYVTAFGRAMNRVYEIEEGRPFWKLRPVMLVITLGMLLLVVVVALMLVLSGSVAQSVGDAVGLGSTVLTVWTYAKWPVILVLVVVIVALLYYSTPNVQQPKFRFVSVGAAIAIVVWVVASLLFGLYVTQFASYGKTYGSLAGVVIFLLWLWITNLALLFGAELDAELERTRELEGGIEAERDLQLPARDTTKIEKNEEKREEDEAQGRALRRGASRAGSQRSGSDGSAS